MYRARNIIKNDAVAVKLETITHSSSVQHEYNILKHLEGGIGIPCALWFGRESTYHALILDLLGPSLHSLFLSHSQKFSLETVINLGDQLLSCLKYVHSHNYIHGEIKPQNIVLGLGNTRHTTFIIDFSITKEFWNMSTSVHILFHQGQCLTGTPTFESINNHLGFEPGRCDDLKSPTYMLIYFFQGSLPWLTSDQEKLSSSSILKCKVNTTIEDLCYGIPVEFATILIYTRSLAFSEDPNYNHLHSLLCTLHSTLPAPAACLLDINQPGVPITHSPSPPFFNKPCVIEAVPPCLPLHRSTCV
ncbi:putative serine/threonine-protein kinase vrk [Suillus fuscotomentosus]|uniref:Serine/threonine-protein kinase vrk n=1 Tax=Suillus fuscotomentosus TaxID=1912939 RepID=A0AAD4EFR6_9AGAM|nr:putative serine/threonine-protein kinase vrk [Suillus fuscotomentosus]KAG1904189.1 putative serine/threonine-protein kinase vrk [Suillus fuscotomentosus]